MNSPSHFFRVIGLGRLAYNLWHRPLGAMRRCRREGGPIRQIQTELGRRAMCSAASELTAPQFDPKAPSVEVHLLTGHRFWFQTAFCLWSLGTQSHRRIVPVLYDDGSLSAEQGQTLQRIFPAARIVRYATAVAALEQHLPLAQFPILRERWQNYPNIRKLIDPHIGSCGWKLVIDSDLLFFRKPDALLRWIETHDAPLHAVDCTESYGYSRPLMERLAGAPIPRLVNVGLCGLQSSSLDWSEIERWCATLIREERTNYYLEQALVAMLVARKGHCYVLPAGDYVTFPSSGEALRPTAVMHHFVDTSKQWYFCNSWKQALART